MNDSGIISQYGFLYQRKAFMLYAMRHAGAKQLFIFEGRDDVEIGSDDKIYAIQDSNGCCIQVKSGHVSEECFSRIICNWLLLDDTKTTNFELALENDLSFDCSQEERVASIYEFILSGEKKKKTAIARKTYEKYKDQLDEGTCSVKEQVISLLNRLKKSVMSMEEYDQELAVIFNEHYCSDITDYEVAKSKRLERFLSYINLRIDDAIKNKKPYTLLYKDFVQLVLQVKEEINDKKYTVDIKSIKNKSKEPARKIVEERVAREVKQLFLIDSREDFVIEGIVHELMYKDFRSVFEQRKTMELSNLEQTAKENYESAKFSLSDIDFTPKNVFIKTVDKQIESELLPPGPIYRKGCYIYLTGEGIQEDVQITWGEENDTE
ncbi:hypothetical protein KDC22_11580 [Paenibacillus tritici]|uniref:hypothetical protein n=1 Tax=Paenibacillus tritici TaxID=1873425 RepID=UPI001BAB65D3|nr:hypothetical protein [Paenibacillus tritici]QUL57051.1 hypothetical protein KDC22_11580 [Paenibacillus tritici]